MLSKDFKFIPTQTSPNKTLLKEELECFGKNLPLLWHFWKEDSITISNQFKKKSTFNLKEDKVAAIELYLSRLEEEITETDTKLSYSNLTKKECLAINSFRDDTYIIINKVDKCSGEVVCDKENYLKEAEKQLCDKEHMTNNHRILLAP